MKKFVSITVSLIVLFIASYSFAGIPGPWVSIGPSAEPKVNQPFYTKKFHVVEINGEYHLSTSYVKGINTLKDDVGYIINRENGIWERDKAWEINLKPESATKDALISTFENKIVPTMDKAFLADMKLTVSIWIVSNRVLIMFDQSHWGDREFHERMCEKINAVL